MRQLSRRYEKVDDENFREIEEKTTPLKMSELQKQKADWELVASLTQQQLEFAVIRNRNQMYPNEEIARLTSLISELGALRAEAIPR